MLESLARRYDAPPMPTLNEVEAVLWEAGVSDSPNFGWSFPCAEALALLRRVFRWEGGGRIIDVGAGSGLWTKVLAREFGSDMVVGLDPHPGDDAVIAATFGQWCDQTGGPDPGDSLFASWLPCAGQEGSDLGTQVLDCVRGEHQMFFYVGSGPFGPVGTDDFYERLAVEFVEYATEPLPRPYPGVFPRDFIRAYCRRS